MARLAVLLVFAATSVAVALPAAAATPAEGTVSADAREARWTGAVTDPAGVAYAAAAEAGSTADVCSTPAPACDDYTLHVAGEGAVRLTVSVTADAEDDRVGLSVTAPGGAERVAFGESAKETITIDKPVPGAYAVRVLGSSSRSSEVAYSGLATLEPAPPPPPPPPATSSSTARQPSHAPAGEQGPPPPPVQAGPRELAVEADVRRVRTAALKGFRARLVCRGGCQTVRLRVFVSSLTARIYRLAKAPRGDVRVGGARPLRDAEGRRVARITFKRGFRRKLARAKNLTLAVEAVARDPDGRVRTSLKRILLRR